MPLSQPFIWPRLPLSIISIRSISIPRLFPISSRFQSPLSIISIRSISIPRLFPISSRFQSPLSISAIPLSLSPIPLTISEILLPVSSQSPDPKENSKSISSRFQSPLSICIALDKISNIIPVLSFTKSGASFIHSRSSSLCRLSNPSISNIPPLSISLSLGFSILSLGLKLFF